MVRTTAVVRARDEDLPRGGSVERDVDEAIVMRTVLEVMWPCVDIYNGERELREGLQFATGGQAALFAIRWCDSEVRNGGFHQLFRNPTGILVPEALEGFSRIGAREHARCFVQAKALLPFGEVPRDRAERIDRLEEIPYAEWKTRIRPIEDAYYALRTTDQNLDRLAACYVGAHVAEFFVGAEM
jgi:hypothetical protein